MRVKNKLVRGVGINDADYPIASKANGRQVRCPFYIAWTAMLSRCYGGKKRNVHPTYLGCTVCDEWLTFSNFKSWMEKQDWKGKHLDKDLLVKGNKVYSPDACVFVDSATNNFTIDSGAARGNYMIGVSMNKKLNKFQSYCRAAFERKNIYLGLFSSELDAHMAWKKCKHKLACELANFQTDERVANALRNRYI